MDDKLNPQRPVRLSEAADVVESNYGRRTGWYLVCGTEVLAELNDDRSEDMFWDSYRFVACTDAPEWTARFCDPDFWGNGFYSLGCAFRSRAFDREVSQVIVSELRLQGNRLVVRGLYIKTHPAMAAAGAMLIGLRRLRRTVGL